MQHPLREDEILLKINRQIQPFDIIMNKRRALESGRPMRLEPFLFSSIMWRFNHQSRHICEKMIEPCTPGLALPDETAFQESGQ